MSYIWELLILSWLRNGFKNKTNTHRTYGCSVTHALKSTAWLFCGVLTLYHIWKSRNVHTVLLSLMHFNWPSAVVIYPQAGLLFALVGSDNHEGLFNVLFSFYIIETCLSLLHNTHTQTHISSAWIMTFSSWRSPTFQSSLEETELAASHRPSRDNAACRQAGRQEGRQALLQ